MPLPQPEYDTILMREHLFRDTGNLDIVLQKDPIGFKSINEVGLGTFSYKLVDLDSVSNSYSNGLSAISEAFFQTIDFLQTSIVDVTLLIIIVVIISIIISLIYPYFKKNNKYIDLESQVNVDSESNFNSDTSSIEESSTWSATSNSTSTPTSSHHEKFRNSRTPLGDSNINISSNSSINEKDLVNILRID